MLDIRVCNSIGALVEKLSTTGKDIMDMKKLKELFVLAGTTEEYLKFFHARLIQQLEKQHAEIRFGTFLIIDHLFMRSEYYRRIFLDDFEEFLELVVESDINKPLPPPLSAAKKLKQNALQAIQKWYLAYAKEDQRLQIGYNFIKNTLKVDFEDAEKRTAVEIANAKQKSDRQERIVHSRIAALRVEVDENVEEISRVVTEMDNCFGLLIPSLDNFLHDVDNDKDGSNLNFREHGLGSGSRSTIKVCIQLPGGNTRIQKTTDNEAILQNLKDLYSLCKNRLLPRTRKWIQMVCRGEDQDLFKRIMNMKQMVQSEMNRFEELTLDSSVPKEDSDNNNYSTDSDSDFEDVPDKDGFEEFVKETPAFPPITVTPLISTSKVVDSNESWNLGRVDKEDDAQDPTTIKANIDSLKKLQSQKFTNMTTFSNLGNPLISHATVQMDSKLGNSKTNGREENMEVSTEVGSSGLEKLQLKNLSRKEKLLQAAPKLPFDIDLYHWEDVDLKAPSIELVESDSAHRFWQPSDREGEVIEAQDGVSVLRRRTIEFSGKFEPVKWSCRAPLKSGKLCPRRDRVKCPLHGKIVSRDESGNPTQSEDIAKLEELKARAELKKPPEWQDPEFLKDLQAEIGIDLTIRKPRKGRKRKTFAELYPGLTDLKKEKKTPRARLSKKIFNRSSLLRVAEEMDTLTHNRFRDKFGDQYNYSYDT